jgi:hypothetical protein
VNGKEICSALDEEEVEGILNSGKSPEEKVHDLYTKKLYKDMKSVKDQTPLDSIIYEVEYGLPITYWDGYKPKFDPDDPLGEIDILGVEDGGGRKLPKLYVIEVKNNLCGAAKYKGEKQLKKANLLPFEVEAKLLGSEDIIGLNPAKIAQWNFIEEFNSPGHYEDWDSINLEQKACLDFVYNGSGLEGRNSLIRHPNGY